MNRTILENRTKSFHVAVIRFCQELPRTPAAFEIARQLIRSAGSVGANYRATKRAKSKADFIYKIGVVLEEMDESLYWLEVIEIAGIKNDKDLHNLLAEANELTAIFAKTDKTAKLNRSI